MRILILTQYSDRLMCDRTQLGKLHIIYQEIHNSLSKNQLNSLFHFHFSFTSLPLKTFKWGKLVNKNWKSKSEFSWFLDSEIVKLDARWD
jgi:hypothetical protein